MQEGDILAINSIGKAFKGQFDVYASYFLDDFYHEDPTYFEEYLEIFSHFWLKNRIETIVVWIQAITLAKEWGL